jgi:hypothetical protein
VARRTAGDFLRRLIAAVPYKVHTVLTDNGTHFTYFYETHDQLRAHLRDLVNAYNLARRLKTLRGLTPHEFLCKAWTSEPQRFKLNPLQQTPGLNT